MNNAKPVELACGHVLWFKYQPQSEDETLWCAKCGMYREIQQATTTLEGAWTYWPELDFKSKKLRKRNVYDGRCTYADENGECRYEIKAIWSWQALRDKMHSHYMRMHTKNGGIEIVYADRLPKGSEPPF